MQLGNSNLPLPVMIEAITIVKVIDPVFCVKQQHPPMMMSPLKALSLG